MKINRAINYIKDASEIGFLGVVGLAYYVNEFPLYVLSIGLAKLVSSINIKEKHSSIYFAYKKRKNGKITQHL